MRIFTALILLFFCLHTAFAQRTCYTQTYFEKIQKDRPASANMLAKPGRDTLAGEIITIPVVVHVVFKNSEENISDAQVISQIEALNKDFSRMNTDTVNTPSEFRKSAADCGIRFRLALLDPQGRLTNGVIRKQTVRNNFGYDDAVKFSAKGGSDAWDPARYLNIWVCNMGSQELGYSSMPGSAMNVDGVVINYDVFGTRGFLRGAFNKGRTATHEVGHWLGLKHIWGDRYCGDDGIDDTPPQKSYNQGCPSFPKISECSQNSHGDMFMNFMDYANDECMNIFTVGQAIKMRSQFAAGNVRNSLLDPAAFDTANASPSAPIAEPSIAVSQTESLEISIGPNPVMGVAKIRPVNGGILAGKKFLITDCQGRPVLRFIASGGEHTLDLSALRPGIYLLQSATDSESKPVRIVKLP